MKNKEFEISMIHYSLLIPSERNNYSVDSIKELANMILLSGGIKQNLLAREKDGHYELIAGHRRRLAAQYLVEEAGLEEYAYLPVRIEESGDVLSEIDLILTNCGTRERSDWEKMMEVTRLTELVKTMRSGTAEEQDRFRQLFGRDPGLAGGRELRKIAAETLGLSETKVANLNNINSNLSPGLRERFETGEIGVSVANEAASLPLESQQELAEKKEIKLADVKAEKKKAVSDSDTEEQIPGQTELLDIPGVDPENADGSCENGSESEESNAEMAAEPLSAYGTPKRVYPPDSLIATEGCEGGHDCFGCAMDCRIRQEDRYCREAPLGNPFPCEIVKGGFTELPEGCQFVDHDLAYHCAGSGEPDPCCKDCQDPCEYICGRAMRALNREAEIPEEDQEIAAISQQEEMSDMDLLRSMLEKEKNTLEEMLKANKADPHPDLKKMIRKKKLLVGALAGMLCDLDQPKLPEKEDVAEQPDLPVLKNNDQRKQFLETFHDWPIWFEVPEAAEVYYRYDLEDGCSLVICEYHYWAEWLKQYGDSPERTGTREYLLMPGYHYLNDCKSNRTAMVEKLKEIQKGGKG